MKSVLPSTKFKLHAQERPSQKRLQAPIDGYLPPPLSGSAILKDPQSGSQTARRLLGAPDQLSKPRMASIACGSCPLPITGSHRSPAISFSAISRVYFKFGSGSSPDSALRTWVPKRLSSSLMTWSQFLLEECAFRIYAYPMANPFKSERPGHRANKRIAKLRE